MLSVARLTAARHISGGLMLDLIFVLLVLMFFGLSFWYVVFCQKV